MTVLYLWISIHLAQILRCLASQGIFKEIALDTFANNRLSSLLDKGLSGDDIRIPTLGYSFLCISMNSPRLTILPREITTFKNPSSSICALLCHVYVFVRSSTPLAFYMIIANILHMISTDESAIASTHLCEALSDQSASGRTSFARAFNTDKSFWEFLELPDQRHRLARFGTAMEGVGRMEPPGAVLRGKLRSPSPS